MSAAGTALEQMDDISQSNLLHDLYENLEAEGVQNAGQGSAPIGGGGGAGSGVSGGGDNNREPMMNAHIPQPPVRQETGGEGMEGMDGNGEDEIIEEYIIEEPEDTRTTARKVYDEVKTPLLVFGIFFVLSLRFLDRQMATYIPSCVNDYRRLNFLGILLKALLAGLLFFVLNRYVLERF